MVKAFILGFFILCFFATSIHAQTFQGVVRDTKSVSPIPYVNIGVVGKNNGTVTDEEGNFSITLDKENYPDSIRFSMVGYLPVTLEVRHFLESAFPDHKIYLNPKTTTLREVIVSSKGTSSVTMGHKPRSKNTNAGFVNNRLGHEIGTYFKGEDLPILLDSVRLNVAKCTYEKIFLRLNVYEVSDMKEQNILPEPIYLSYTKAEALNNPVVDLTRFNLLINSDFIISVEIIKELGVRGLSFYATVKTEIYPTVYRETSQGNWLYAKYKGKPVGISFQAFVH